MMVIEFKDLFSIDVRHDYYDGRCPDLTLEPVGHTAGLFRGGRAFAKAIDGTLRSLFEADESGNPISSLAGRTVRFGIRLLNPHFHNFTNLDFSPRELAVYRNRAAKDALDDPVACVPASGPMPHDLSRNTRPVTVRLTSSDGIVVQETVLEVAENRDSVTLNFSNLPGGLYTLEESYPSPPKKKTSYYLEPDIAHELFGVAEIRLDPSFYATPPSFHINFQAREEVLRYYLVVHGYSVGEFNSLNIVDAGAAAASRPEIKFDRVAASGFTAAELPPEVIAANGARVAAFRSRSPVARKEGGRQRIQLSNNGEVLRTNLPQPVETKPSADLVIHLSKNT